MFEARESQDLCVSSLHFVLMTYSHDFFIQALQEQLTSTVQEIGHLIDPVSTAARGEASQLGHKVCKHQCTGMIEQKSDVTFRKHTMGDMAELEKN